MTRTAISLITLFALTTTALAKEPVTPTEEVDVDQMVLLNASSSLADMGGIDRLRRVLGQRGMLAKLDERLEATLDGRNVLIAEIDAIREAYAKLEYDAALEIITANEERILGAAGSGDMIPALAQLFEWRGMIAAAQENNDEAIRQFRAAMWLNPAWQPDRKLGASPTIRKLVKKAKRPIDEVGKLRVESPTPGAMLTVDGGKPVAAGEKLDIAVGVHLIVVTAEGFNTYAELVDVEENEFERFEIELVKESKSDRAAKIVDATMAAAPGKARLAKVKRLEKLTKQTRYLIVESNSDSNIKFRLYDIDAIKVSKPIILNGSETSAEITAKITAALDPDNMLDPSTIMVVEKQRSQRWYERWYVWVGIGAVVGGGILTYQYMSREPETVRGF
ncbi:MAG: PEGA domain-containing protein [Myxococcota bacterium]|nr:PEGA domain-containing protein [Myxococcota bacterium]